MKEVGVQFSANLAQLLLGVQVFFYCKKIYSRPTQSPWPAKIGQRITIKAELQHFKPFMLYRNSL